MFRDFDLETVDEVVFKSKADTIHLRYNGSSWTVNEKYPADRDMIRVFFATLQQAEPKRPVATSIQDSIMQVLTTDGVHVSILIDGDKVQDILVGGNLAKTETYFAKPDHEMAYVMMIPGYRVFVGGIFEMNESGWRDKYAFKMNWENFASFEARFKNAVGNFEVKMDDRTVRIEGVAQLDTAKINEYMDYLSLLKVDEYVPANPALDSLGKTLPEAQFMVRDIGGKEHTLKLFAPRASNRFYALLNASQWSVIQADRILPVLRPKEFFVKR
jgi:hypothetical protein